MTGVHVIDHPLVQHKLTLLRRKDASTNSFRTLLHEIATLMTYEVLRGAQTNTATVVGTVIADSALYLLAKLRSA